MPVFPIKWKLPSEPQCGRLCRDFFKLNLNEEFKVLCIVFRNSLRVWAVDSIEIHLKNDAGILVSGKLKFEKAGAAILEQKISESMKPGSLFTQICTNLFPWNIGPNCSITGFLDISNINEKKPTSLSVINLSTTANKVPKEKTYLNSLEELSKDFERLLNPESSCIADVTLKCDSVSIPAHKLILSARSPVFAAMFASPMKENIKNEVDVTDIDVSTLRALLMYIYTGKPFHLTASSAEDLLFAAEKYQLRHLKAVCIAFLKETVSVENIWKILVLGDMYSEDLKSFAIDYICNKSSEFSGLKNTEGWKALRNERPDLAMDLLESMVK